MEKMTPNEEFGLLYDEYAPMILRYFQREFDFDTADDLCQQTFLNVWKYITIIANERPKKKKAWLLKIAKNVKNDHLRYRMIRPQSFDYSDITELSVSGKESAESMAMLRVAISLLSPEEKRILLMSESMKSREIAKELGISASAVRSRLQKARKHLREFYEWN